MNKTIALVIAFVVVAGGAFYGGMKYDQSSASAARAGRFGQFGAGAGVGTGQGGARGNRAGGGFAVGDVIAKDAQSITIKLNNGGSSIVFFTASTTVMKSSSGSASDVAVGTQVMVTGSTNSDGSINAQSIQIRPAGSARLPQ